MLDLNQLNLNERDPTLPASGLEDRTYGRNQIGYFDCAGDFPASRNCTWNGAWAATDQGIFDRHDGLHVDRGRDTGTTRNVRDPTTIQIDLLQPVRIHDR